MFVMDLVPVSHIYVISLFLYFTFITSPGVSSTILGKDGQCVMYGQCDGEFGTAPCVYNGLPKPLDNTAMPSTYNVTAVQLLKDMCPDFVHDGDPHVCCTTEQLVAFHTHMMMAETLGFGRCPSCMQNFRKIVCYLSCSPEQSRYVDVVKSYKSESNEEVVEVTNYYVSKHYAYTLYNSCKDLQGITPGTLIMDFVCGPWGAEHCSPERWTEYMGSTPAEGAYSPFKTNYILSTEDVIYTDDGHTLYAMNATVTKCSESPGLGYEACSCNDCKESCSIDLLKAPELEPIPEPLKLFSLDGPSVIAAIVF